MAPCPPCQTQLGIARALRRVTQLVECWLYTPDVAGSSPVPPTLIHVGFAIGGEQREGAGTPAGTSIRAHAMPLSPEVL